MVRIPDEYQEVEYLESTGTQWIDTGTTINNGCVISIDFYIADTAVNRIIWGYRRDRTYQYPYQAFIGANNKKLKYIAFGIHSDNIPDVFDYDIRNSVVIDSVNKTIKVNGEIKDCYENFDNGKAFNLDGSSEYHPYLFAINSMGSELAISSDTKIYGYSVSYGENFSQHLIPCYRKSDNEPGMYDTVTGTFFTSQGTGTFLKGNDVTYDTVNLMESRRRILLNTPHLESLSGATASFETDMSAKLKECKVYFSPVQDGTGDPSPDNVRPISGWDGVTVTRCGKNLLDKTILESGTFGSSGNNVTNANRVRTGWIKVLPNTTITLSVDSGLQVYAYNVKDASMKTTYHADNAKGTLKTTYTIPSDGHYIRIAYARTNTSTALSVNEVLQPQIELGSTPTTYEPYTAQSLTIPFPQTIYGGYVDLVNGEVVEEWKEYTYPEKTNLFTDRGNGYYEVGFGNVGGKGYGSANNSMCSKLSYGFRTSTLKLGYELNYVLLGISNRFHTLVYSDTPMTAATARQWFIDNNIQLVRLVNSTTTYPLNPVTIRTLRGLNNLWSDANGNIELKFWTH